MANFENAFKLVIENEGGFSNDVKDSGGKTQYGISDARDGKVDGMVDLDGNGTGDVLVQNLTLENASKIYKREYWDVIKGDSIVSQAMAESIFDFAVNAGTSTSIKMAQRIVGAKDDGDFGNLTISKINSFNEKLFIPLFTIEKIRKYVSICLKTPDQKKFLLGWIVRSIK